MKNIFLAALMRNTVAASLALTLSISSSLFVLAASPENKKLLGELTVSGASLESDTAFVTIDGERALTGRSVLPSSNITTANFGATVSLGETGRVEIAPNSSINLEFTEKSINANLTAGKVKIYNAAGVEAKVTTKDDVVTGKAGEVNTFAVDVQSGATSVLAETGVITQASGQTTTGQTTGGVSAGEALIPVAIIGGITAVAVIYVLTRDDEELQIQPPVLSPVR